jgi:hypothetical protein
MGCKTTRTTPHQFFGHTYEIIVSPHPGKRQNKHPIRNGWGGTVLLCGGVEALFSVLPGGDEVLFKRRAKLRKGDVPPILSLGVSAKEQKYLRIGRDTGNSEVENEATKRDEAEVPLYLWNERLTRPWRSLKGPNDTVDVERDKTLHKAVDAIRNKFALPWWKRNVLISFRVWFKITYRMPVGLNLPKMAVWGK